MYNSTAMAVVTQVKSRRVDGRTRAARAARRDARAALLDAAAAVFAERGFSEASVDEIAERAGYSKGALYWHFASKDDLFFAMLEARVDRRIEEAIELVESAPAEQDMAPVASRVLMDLLRGAPEALLLEQEYWSQAVRHPDLRVRYANRHARLRSALDKALKTRAKRLGAPVGATDGLATAIMAIASGLAREKLIAPDAVPDDLLGNSIALMYMGTVARAQAKGER